MLLCCMLNKINCWSRTIVVFAMVFYITHMTDLKTAIQLIHCLNGISLNSLYCSSLLPSDYYTTRMAYLKFSLFSERDIFSLFAVVLLLLRNSHLRFVLHRFFTSFFSLFSLCSQTLGFFTSFGFVGLVFVFPKLLLWAVWDCEMAFLWLVYHSWFVTMTSC